MSRVLVSASCAIAFAIAVVPVRAAAAQSLAQSPPPAPLVPGQPAANGPVVDEPVPTSSQPVASDGKTDKPAAKDTEKKLPKWDGAYSLVLGLAAARLDVNLDTRQSTQAGGVLLAGSMFGYRDAGAFTIRGGAFSGWGGGSLEGRANLDVFGGIGLPAAEGGQAFIELGTSTMTFKNDELNASLIAAPMAFAGYQQHFDGFGFQLGPRGGFALRTEFDPGEEDAGRRHHRSLKPRLAYGGALGVASKHLLLDAALTRVEAADPVYAATAQACVLVSVLSTCGFVDYWRSIATSTGPAPPVLRDVSVTYIGLAIGIGIGGAEVGSRK